MNQNKEGTKKEKEQEIKVKLPHFEITKFKGTHFYWVRFWTQFEAEIKKSKLPSAVKFSYLKSFAESKVKS